MNDYECWMLECGTAVTCPDCDGTVSSKDETVGALLSAIDRHECPANR